MPSGRVAEVSDVQDRRAGVCLSADWGHVSVLLGGGHIFERETQRTFFLPVADTFLTGAFAGKQ